MPITADGRHFKDETGRVIFLRGVNLSGGKVPADPPGFTHLPQSLDERRDVSFVGRPFPLEEADDHFARLRHWGMNCVRLVVTWEALEHAAPGEIDEDFLDYITAVAEIAQRHDINVIIDPHQDVWSRFSGGDGAPAWTFDAAGLDSDKFAATAAAITHQQNPELPHLMWASNYNRFAAQTMFTLFFAGDTFAPDRQIDGRSLQAHLQSSYISAFQTLASRIAHLPNVIGFGVMNEPSPGLIGRVNLRSTDESLIQLGVTPSPAQAIFLANGFAQTCLDFGSPLIDRLPGRTREATIDPKGERAWKDGVDDVWREAGVWDVDADGKPRLLRPAHFAGVDFLEDCLKPFTLRFAAAIHEVMPSALIFIEAEPFAPPPRFESPDKLVYSPHYYDIGTMLSRRFHPQVGFDFMRRRLLLGASALAEYTQEQIARFRQYADSALGDVPIVVGEFGIPFDLNGKSAYRNGDFSAQENALDYMFRAMDAELLSYTQWNYAADNTNEHGDLWNREDFSIFSRDHQGDRNDINSGGRALAAVARPYARKIGGEPLSMGYDRVRGRFTFSFRHDDGVDAPTEIFVPNGAFPKGFRVELSDGEVELEPEKQRLLYRHGGGDEPHTLCLISNAPATAEKESLTKLGLVALAAVLALLLLRRSGRSRQK